MFRLVSAMSEDFGRERDDSHEFFLTQFARDGEVVVPGSGVDHVTSQLGQSVRFEMPGLGVVSFDRGGRRVNVVPVEAN